MVLIWTLQVEAFIGANLIKTQPRSLSGKQIPLASTVESTSFSLECSERATLWLYSEPCLRTSALFASLRLVENLQLSARLSSHYVASRIRRLAQRGQDNSLQRGHRAIISADRQLCVLDQQTE